MRIKSKRACFNYQKISKQTLLVMISPSILDKVSKSQWSITSFDPNTRTVCVKLDNGFKLQHISFILPTLN